MEWPSREIRCGERKKRGGRRAEWSKSMEMGFSSKHALSGVSTQGSTLSEGPSRRCYSCWYTEKSDSIFFLPRRHCRGFPTQYRQIRQAFQPLQHKRIGLAQLSANRDIRTRSACVQSWCESLCLAWKVGFWEARSILHQSRDSPSRHFLDVYMDA